MIAKVKNLFLSWILDIKDKTALELYKESNPQEVAIPDAHGNLKFTAQGALPETLVSSPSGFIPIKKALKTIPYQPYKMRLNNGMELIAADEHLVITPSGEKALLNLQPNEQVITIDGPSAVIDVVRLPDSPVEMYDFEVEHEDHVYYTNGILSHNTTVIAAFLLWFACFNLDKYILVASKDNDAAMDVLGRIRFSYEELPMWLKPGATLFNQHTVSFDNGSTIRSQATTENTGRGRSVSLLMIDELAFVRQEIQSAMWASLAPTLSTGGKCIISSTPNGDQELFAQLWREAQSGGAGSFHPIFAPWDRHPERDEKYKAEMIGKVGELVFRQEYNSLIDSTSINILHDGIKRQTTFGELYKLLYNEGKGQIRTI
jgi:hypothetical protein